MKTQYKYLSIFSDEIFVKSEITYIHKWDSLFNELDILYHTLNQIPKEIVLILNLKNHQNLNYCLIAEVFAAESDEKEYVYGLEFKNKGIVNKIENQFVNISIINDDEKLNNTMSQEAITSLENIQTSKDLLDQKMIYFKDKLVNSIMLNDISAFLKNKQYSQAIDHILSSDLFEELKYYIKENKHENLFNLNKFKQNIFLAPTGTEKTKYVVELITKMKEYVINEYLKIYELMSSDK